MVKIEVVYNEGEPEIFEAEQVTVLQGCFQVEKKAKQNSNGPLVSVEEVTDSEYIPFSSVKKIRTLNSEE